MTTQTHAKKTKTQAATKTTKEGALPIGRFCWTSLRAPDIDKSTAFYAAVCGWGFERKDMGGPEKTPLFVGQGGPVCHVEPTTGPAHFVSYVVVEDLSAALRRVTAAGGRIVGAVSVIPTVGSMQDVEDADGACFAVFQPESADVANKTAGDGAFIWNELHARDVKSALAFLSSVIGFGVDAMPFGPITYNLLKGPAPRADETLHEGGVMPALDGKSSSSWVPYIQVKDVARAQKAAVDNGGTALGAIASDPNVGTWAFLLDPQGARFAVMTRATR